jgi:hypothetical protein
MRKSPRKTTEKNKHITRMDYTRTHGYNVRIPLPAKTKYDAFFFSDRVYGGKRKALTAARTFRDRELKLRGMVGRIPPRKSGPHAKQGNNTSGIIGISRLTSFDEYGSYSSWCANWHVKGKKGRKQFSNSKHTEEEAFKLACIARIEKVGPLEIIDKNARLPLSLYKIRKLNEVYSHGNP